MATVPLRKLRACVEHICPHVPTKRELAQMQYILSAATMLFAQRGPFAVSFARFAFDIGVSSNVLQRLYCDIEHLLGEILRNHIAALMAELNTIPENAPNRPAQCRAAYHRLIRGPDGKLTDEHVILVRHIYALPSDELAPTEARRAELNAMLGAGTIGVIAATILDGGAVTLDRAEAMLAVLADPGAAQAKGLDERRKPAGGHPPSAAHQNKSTRAPQRQQTRTDAQEPPNESTGRPPGTVLH